MSIGGANRRGVIGAVVASVIVSSIVEAQGTAFDLLVSSRGTHSVKRFDGESGAYLGDFVAPGAGGLQFTQELLEGPDHSLLVSGRGTPTILRFDLRTGASRGSFTSGTVLDQPTKMRYAGNRTLYVAQWGSTRSTIAAFDSATGAYLRDVTPAMGQPMQLIRQPNGELLVIGFNTATVRRISASGTDLGAFTSGKALQGPVNLWYHPSGDLLVMDWTAGTIERFNGTTGAFVNTFITGLSNPEGYAIGPDSALYIAEWTTHRVRRFDRTTGVALGVFAEGGGLMNPNSLLFIPRPPSLTRRPAVVGTATISATGPALTRSTTLRVAAGDGVCALCKQGTRFGPGMRFRHRRSGTVVDLFEASFRISVRHDRPFLSSSPLAEGPRAAEYGCWRAAGGAQRRAAGVGMAVHQRHS